MIRIVLWSSNLLLNLTLTTTLATILHPFLPVLMQIFKERLWNRNQSTFLKYLFIHSFILKVELVSVRNRFLLSSCSFSFTPLKSYNWQDEGSGWRQRPGTPFMYPLFLLRAKSLRSTSAFSGALAGWWIRSEAARSRIETHIGRCVLYVRDRGKVLCTIQSGCVFKGT